MSSIPPKMQELAQMAAKLDAEEGSFRTGANVAVLMTWAAAVRLEHGPCGQLELVTSATGFVVGITCPTHGTVPAPEWQEKP